MGNKGISKCIVEKVDNFLTLYEKKFICKSKLASQFGYFMKNFDIQISQLILCALAEVTSQFGYQLIVQLKSKLASQFGYQLKLQLESKLASQYSNQLNIQISCNIYTTSFGTLPILMSKSMGSIKAIRRVGSKLVTQSIKGIKFAGRNRFDIFSDNFPNKPSSGNHQRSRFSCLRAHEGPPSLPTKNGSKLKNDRQPWSNSTPDENQYVVKLRKMCKLIFFQILLCIW